MITTTFGPVAARLGRGVTGGVGLGSGAGLATGVGCGDLLGEAGSPASATPDGSGEVAGRPAVPAPAESGIAKAAMTIVSTIARISAFDACRNLV